MSRMKTCLVLALLLVAGCETAQKQHYTETEESWSCSQQDIYLVPEGIHVELKIKGYIEETVRQRECLEVNSPTEGFVRSRGYDYIVSHRGEKNELREGGEAFGMALLYVFSYWMILPIDVYCVVASPDICNQKLCTEDEVLSEDTSNVVAHVNEDIDGTVKVAGMEADLGDDFILPQDGESIDEGVLIRFDWKDEQYAVEIDVEHDIGNGSETCRFYGSFILEAP